jgi:hypothetical protein
LLLRISHAGLEKEIRKERLPIDFDWALGLGLRVARGSGLRASRLAGRVSRGRM